MAHRYISSAWPIAPALCREAAARGPVTAGRAAPQIRGSAWTPAAPGYASARCRRWATAPPASPAPPEPASRLIQRLARGTAGTVSPDLRDAVARTYEAWWDKRPPETTRQQKAAAAAARRRAARANWCAGAGLDDDLLDQPGYRPESGWKPARGTGVAADSGGPVTSLKGTDMSCDRRHTAALVADVLAVLHQHGYRPGDLVHAHRAVRLIGDLARIYQGTQDAPAGAYIIQVPPGSQPDASIAAVGEANGGDGGEPEGGPDPADGNAPSSSRTAEPYGSDEGGAR